MQSVNKSDGSSNSTDKPQSVRYFFPPFFISFSLIWLSSKRKRKWDIVGSEEGEKGSNSNNGSTNLRLSSPTVSSPLPPSQTYSYSSPLETGSPPSSSVSLSTRQTVSNATPPPNSVEETSQEPQSKVAKPSPDRDAAQIAAEAARKLAESLQKGRTLQKKVIQKTCSFLLFISLVFFFFKIFVLFELV